MRQVIAGLGVGAVGIAFIAAGPSAQGQVSGYIGGGLLLVGLLFVLTGLRQMRISGNDQNGQ
jgi:hypothetical protein